MTSMPADGKTVGEVMLRSNAMMLGHPAVEATAVVGGPDDRLGERPCAFVKLKEGRDTFMGAPTILNIIAEAPFAGHRPLPTKVDLVIAGALPPLEILNNVHELGFNVSHAYGMTEALGPVTVRSLELDQYDRASIIDSDGVHNVVMEGVDVKDPTTMTSVPVDGKPIGEVMLRSNTMMLTYKELKLHFQV
ncbi:hypothetical protein RHGRI_030437 [Rhododendron griersonianum]|uniref:AMP-dependent synthetase/ligase domain-containing protein n=1 Tax=Rhododendron griersonianum TaxID=479676 RepID=A0AAV6ITB2_9ERIC|nr:hypothetical protein RHGRI_030437 [Rhododendron griersonianum]